jgi:hypothetical protein
VPRLCKFLYFMGKRFFIATKKPRHADRISIFFLDPACPGWGLGRYSPKNIPALPQTPTSIIIKQNNLQP